MNTITLYELSNDYRQALDALTDPENDLPAEVTAAAAPAWRPDDHRTLAAIEREYIEAVVRAAGGHRAQAAAQLGIGVATLYRKLAAYRAADRAPARRRKPR